ncbi:hypothetical protein WA158_000591 [Blastocystis sp. Blastoise]
MSSEDKSVQKLDIAKYIDTELQKYHETVEMMKREVNSTLNATLSNSEIIFNNMKKMMSYIREKESNPQSTMIKPVLDEIKSLQSMRNEDSVLVLYGFSKSVSKYSIELSLLNKYPGSLLTEIFRNNKKREDNVINTIDHDDLLFPAILYYMKTNVLDIKDKDEYYIAKLYSDFRFYNLPIPLELIPYGLEKDKQEKWFSSIINVKVEDKIYMINREDLQKRRIDDSYFDHPVNKSIQYDMINNIFILTEQTQYFQYICDYIEAGEIFIKEDPSYIPYIRKTFDYYSIPISDFEFNKCLSISVSSFFQGSTLLNTQHAIYLAGWLGLEKKWTIIYKGSVNGYNASDFHHYCDNCGETMTLIYAKGSDDKPCLFGGYTSISWTSPNFDGSEKKRDPESFLFTLANPHDIPPTKFPCILTGWSVCHCALNGPVFGLSTVYNGADLCVLDHCNNSKGAWSFFNSCYGFDNTTEAGTSLFVNTAPDNENNWFKVEDIEVFSLNKV